MVAQTTARALVYSIIEYCPPIRLNSSYSEKIDAQLNGAMRVISGTIKVTPLSWLPILSNIIPSEVKYEGNPGKHC